MDLTLKSDGASLLLWSFVVVPHFNNGKANCGETQWEWRNVAYRGVWLSEIAPVLHLMAAINPQICQMECKVMTRGNEEKTNAPEEAEAYRRIRITRRSREV